MFQNGNKPPTSLLLFQWVVLTGLFSLNANASLSCQDGFYFNSTLDQCTKCDGCPMNLCIGQNICALKLDSFFFDLESLQRLQVCPPDKISAQLLLNDTRIFVNSQSNLYLELGTEKFPYKFIQHALKEVFNYLPADQIGIQILIKQNTTLSMEVLLEKQYVNGAKNLTVRTYDDNNQNNLGQISQIVVKNGIQFRESESTYFNLMGINYQTNKLNFLSDNYETVNDKNELMHGWDIQFNRITFDKMIFDGQGSIFSSLMPMNFNLTNTIGDIKRATSIKIDNITTENLYIQGQVYIFRTSGAPLSMTNFKIKNVTQLQQQNSILQGSSSTRIFWQNDPQQVGQTIIRSLNAPVRGYFEFDNMTFHQNSMYANFQINSCIRSDGFIFRYAEKNLQSGFTKNSIFSNVTVSKSEVNLLLFQGYADLGVKATDQYYFDISSIYAFNNTITKKNSFIQFSQFVNNFPVQVRIFNSVFNDFKYITGGYIIQMNQNDIMPLLINNISLNRNIQAQLGFNAKDQVRTSLPLIVQISNSTFIKNAPIQDALIRVQTNTQIYVDSSYFEENYSLSRGSVFYGDFRDVQLYIKNSQFIKNYAYLGGVFFMHFNGYIELQNCLFQENFAAKGGAGNLENKGYFNISNTIFTLNKALLSSTIHITDSLDNYSLLNNCTFKQNKNLKISETMMLLRTFQPDFQQKITTILSKASTSQYQPKTLDMKNSKIKILNNSSITYERNFIGCFSGYLVMDSHYEITRHIIRQYISQLQINNSQISGLSSLDQGGAIVSHNSDLIIENSNFDQCQSKIGGSIAIMCAGMNACKSKIYTSSFSNNYAILEGGSIYFDSYVPQGLETNTFTNNIAQYGDDIASFPVNINLISQTIQTVASGQKYQGYILAEIVDLFNNRIKLDVSYSINRRQANRTLKRFGQFFRSYIHSEAWVDKYFALKEKFKQMTNARFVRLGHMHLDSIKHCAKIVLKMQIALEDRQLKSIKVTGDLATSGLYAEYNKESQQYPMCLDGYGGNLCQQCVMVNDVQYTRTTGSKCGICPKTKFNVVIFSAVIAIIVYLSIMIIFNINSREDSKIGVLMRILTNYLQIITYTDLLSLKWPNLLREFFNIFVQVGDSVQNLIYFDCFLQNNVIANDQNSYTYFKTVIVGLIPIILILLFLVIYLITRPIKRLAKISFKHWTLVSSILIINFAHPTVVRYIFNMFYCIELDKGQLWLQTDLQVKCWEGDHLKFSLLIGLPLLVFWAILIPLVGFIFLRKQVKAQKQDILDSFQVKTDQSLTISKKQINNNSFSSLSKGLKPEYYYWEFINMFRKLFLVATNVFFYDQIPLFKAMLTLIILFFVYRLQIRYKPYKLESINRLEELEIITTIVAFYGGIYFVNSEISDNVKYVTVGFIIIFNIWFLINWLYCILKCLNFRWAKLLTVIIEAIFRIKDIDSIKAIQDQNEISQQMTAQGKNKEISLPNHEKEREKTHQRIAISSC
ncbi:UNKNOWN [Stylonychia lemnae]|uniref:Transmembrane protein n=1 Tax=Stylonychia lemnae TaxID=5949 RepID=A0A078AA28_STYLE|nr:UNKNOWN [Stylonychia lemnae]|eukprot:CDW79044.1 UNKNOWN [Stylonychia lemnae]